MTILFLFWTSHLLGQSKIEYGSNGGEYIEVADAKIYYEEYGEGQPVLLLHGGMGSISNFNKVIPDLSQHFRLIAIDSPSHGRSYAIDSLSYIILAEYVVKLVDELRLDKFDIVGYSDGAIIGMLVAGLIPDKVGKVVFGAGALSPNASKPEGLKMLQTFSPELLPEEFEKSYKNRSPTPDYWKEFVYASKAMWLEDVWIPSELLPDIKSKVLVLFGDGDQFIPLNHTFEIYKSLPNSELCILPNTSHDVFNNSMITNPILIKFLTEH